MVYCLENSHDMMDNEKHGNLNADDVFDEIKELVVVEEELGLPLDNGYTLFEEVHDSTTLEPTYEESCTF